MDEDGPASFFENVANAMLERSLPAIREWLVGHLPGARVGRVSVDGTRVTVEDSHIPLGASLWLDVSEAILEARPEDLIAGGSPARLHSLRGSVRVVHDGATTFHAPVELKGRPGTSGAWVDAEARVGGATWRHEEGEAGPLYGTALLRIDQDGWLLEDGTLTSGASRTRGQASGSLQAKRRLGKAELATEYARLGSLLEVVHAFRGEPLGLPFEPPLDAVVDGTLRIDSEGTVETEFVARTDASDVAVRGHFRGHEVLDAEIEGTISAAEFLPASLDAFFDRGASAVLGIEAKARGALDRLEGEVELRSDALAVRGLREPAEARAHVEVARSRGIFSVELAGAGELQAELAIGVHGTIEGQGTATLVPEAWQVAEHTFAGSPIRVIAMVSGTRSGPRLMVDARCDAISARRGDSPAELRLRRVGLDGVLRIEGGRVELESGRARARVGPGSIEIDATEDVHLVAQRVDAESALAALGLVMKQDVLGLPGSSARLVIPTGAQLWADLSMRDRRLTGRAHIETARSRLSLAPLHADLATFALDGTEALATLSLEDAIGLGLFAGSPLVPAAPGAVDLRLQVRGAGAATLVVAHGSARRVGWRARTGEHELFATEDLDFTVEARRDALDLRELSGSIFGGRLDGAGSVRREGERTIVRVERATLKGAGDGLSEGILGPHHEAVWRDLRLDGELSGDSIDGFSASASLATAGSELALALHLADGRFGDASGLRGSIDPRDLRPWTGPVTLAGDPIRLDAALRGALGAPRVGLSVRSNALELGWAASKIPIAALELEATLSRDGARCSRLAAEVAGGRLSADGVYSRPFGGWIGRLELEDAQLATIRPLAKELDGALSVKAALWTRLGHGLGGRLRARVDGPRYEALRRFADLFSRYGLRHPPRESREPLIASLTLDDGELALRELEASVEGITARGNVTRSAFGRWKGDLELVAEQSWLETSHLFEHPARWLGDVVVPIRVHGRDGEVRAHADILAALDVLLAKTKLGRGLRKALDALLRRFYGERREERKGTRTLAATTLASTDELVDRIVNDESADAAIASLLERGIPPEEIVERVTRRR